MPAAQMVALVIIFIEASMGVLVMGTMGITDLIPLARNLSDDKKLAECYIIPYSVISLLRRIVHCEGELS